MPDKEPFKLYAVSLSASCRVSPYETITAVTATAILGRNQAYAEEEALKECKKRYPELKYYDHKVSVALIAGTWRVPTKEGGVQEYRILIQAVEPESKGE